MSHNHHQLQQVYQLFIKIHSISLIHRYSILIHIFTFYFRINLDDGAAIRCCTKNGQQVLPNEALHFACLPILIEPDDEFYRQFDQGCINFVRSALASDGQCQLGYGKQVYIKINWLWFNPLIKCIKFEFSIFHLNLTYLYGSFFLFLSIVYQSLR